MWGSGRGPNACMDLFQTTGNMSPLHIPAPFLSSNTSLVHHQPSRHNLQHCSYFHSCPSRNDRPISLCSCFALTLFYWISLPLLLLSLLVCLFIFFRWHLALQVCLELLIAVALRNRDRIVLIWPLLHEYLNAIMTPNGAKAANPLVARVCLPSDLAFRAFQLCLLFIEMADSAICAWMA